MLCFLLADSETGEDVVCAFGERWAPPGSAGLGHSTVGGHVWSKTAHKPARQSGIMGKNRTKESCGVRAPLFLVGLFVCFVFCVSINLSVGTKKCSVSVSECIFIFPLHTLHSVWSHYARCFHPLLNQELGNDCTHSCGTQVCKNMSCIIFPPDTIPLILSPAEVECALFTSQLPCFLIEMHLNASCSVFQSLRH